MRGFFKAHTRALLDETYLGEIIDCADTDIGNGNYHSLKAKLKSEGVRITALGLSEIRRIFAYGKQDIPDPEPKKYPPYKFIDKVKPLRDAFINNIDESIYEKLYINDVGCEIFSLIIFDTKFRDGIIGLEQSFKVKSYLINHQIYDDPGLDDVCNSISIVNKKISSQIQPYRDEIHRLKWIRPPGQVCFAQNICWGNISETHLGDRSCFSVGNKCPAIINEFVKERKFYSLVNKFFEPEE